MAVVINKDLSLYTLDVIIFSSKCKLFAFDKTRKQNCFCFKLLTFVAFQESMRVSPTSDLLCFPCRCHFLCLQTPEELVEQGFKNTCEELLLGPNGKFVISVFVSQLQYSQA